MQNISRIKTQTQTKCVEERYIPGSTIPLIVEYIIQYGIIKYKFGELLLITERYNDYCFVGLMIDTAVVFKRMIRIDTAKNYFNCEAGTMILLPNDYFVISFIDDQLYNKTFRVYHIEDKTIKLVNVIKDDIIEIEKKSANSKIIYRLRTYDRELQRIAGDMFLFEFFF